MILLDNMKPFYFNNNTSQVVFLDSIRITLTQPNHYIVHSFHYHLIAINFVFILEKNVRYKLYCIFVNLKYKYLLRF